jgi:hypothetical protein
MTMLQEITYYLIFGKPLILYLGIITICSFLATAAIPLLRQNGIIRVPFAWHPRLAGLSLALGLVHGTLGVLAYF